jgi:signal transduction histidine kinase
VLARHNLTSSEADDLALRLDEAMQSYTLVAVGSHRVLAMHNGWLVVGVDPLTPFFGDDELQAVGASSVAADLALGRARLFELERQARAAMSDFVAIASHDLRTPVTVIAGFTELMRSQWDVHDDADKQDFLEAIARQVHHLDRLIGDLLTVTKLDVSEIDVFPREVDVERIAREVIAELGVDVDVRVDDRSPDVRAFADPDHVARMFRNYLSNAVTYGEPPIIVEISEQSGSVAACVRDAGTGVAEDFRRRLFEKFARADKKKSKSVGGTGLGLSIVRGLAERNGGEAWYEPDQPTGSRFCFRLPIAAADERAHA